MNINFRQLNLDWNAEPNAPEPRVKIEGHDLLLIFYVNPFQFRDFEEDELGVLRFVNCQKYRLGRTNDEGWYRGQCRFSKLAPRWGEFYSVFGPRHILDEPTDWHVLSGSTEARQHFLFYFRDNTFECDADACLIEPCSENALIRTGKQLPSLL